MTHRGWTYTKTALLLGVLTGILVGVGYMVGGRQMALLGLGIAAVMNFAGYWWSDKLVLSLHGAKPLAEEQAPEIHRIVEELSRRAGIPKPPIYVVEDPAPNAFATGRNPEHAAVCVTTGILELCNQEELSGVLAHELSHVLNRDILISSVAATLAGAVALMGKMFFWSGIMGRRDDRERGGVIGALVVSVVAGLLATLAQLAISRSREYAADETGARLAGTPDGLASALRKLAVASGQIPMETASAATAHLYIVAPLSSSGGPVSWLMTHPPLAKRIERLEHMRGELALEAQPST